MQKAKVTKLFLVTFSTYMLADAFLWTGFNSIILPSLLLGLISNADQLTLITGLVALGAVMTGTMTNIGAGILSDRSTLRMGRRRPFVMVGALVGVFGLAVIGSVSGLVLLVVGYFVLQIAENTATGPYYALLPDLVEPEKTGLVSGVLNAFQFIGSLLGFVVVGALVGTNNVQLAITIEAGVIFIAMLVTVLGVKEASPQPQTGGGSENFFSLRRVPRDLLLLVSSRFFALMGINVLTFFGLYYVSDVLKVGDPALTVAALGGATLLTAMVAGIPAGYLSDKIGRKRLAIIASIPGALALFLLAFVNTFVGLIVAGALFGISAGIIMTTTWAFSSDLAPAGMGGTAMSLSNFSIGAAQAFSPGIGGFIIYFTRDMAGSVMGYRPLFLFAVVYFIAGVLLIWRVREKAGAAKR